MTTIHITQHQKQLLKHLEELQKDLQYIPINSSTNLNSSNTNEPQLKSHQSYGSNKSVQSSQMAELGSRAHPGAELKKGKSYDSAINSECYNDFAESLLPIGQGLQMYSAYAYTEQQSNTPLKSNITQINPNISSTNTPKSSQHPIISKLFAYKSSSNLIHKVSTLMHQYNTQFHHLQQQRSELLSMLNVIHNNTSELIHKQKKYIDLSNGVKEALDYYMMLDNFQFNWVCELGAREMFEDQLQSMLSGLTDAIQFFSMNTNYANSKKYLSGLVSAKTKVISFTKSFFIKLFNKQYGFSIKNVKNHLHKNIDGFYPKSKPKFLTQFVTFFPQFQRQLKVILLSARQSSTQVQSNSLLRRQTQIEQFILNDSSLALITYLQKNNPEVYQQVVLKFISYYRTNFHQNYHKIIVQGRQHSAQHKFQDSFREILIQSFFILASEAAYLQYCFRPCTQIAKEYAKGTMAKVAQFYTAMIIKYAKQPGKNKDPFKICNQVTHTLQQSDKFLRNYASKQYQTYAFGAIIHHIEQFGIEELKAIFQKLANKIKSQMQIVCQNMLPKYKQTMQKNRLTQQVKQFVKLIPNLQYCPTQAQKYLISTLDTIIKSIKQVNSRIQSRLECYAWNIEIFALIQSSLDKLPYTLVKKEMRLDVGQTTKMIQRVKSVNRNQNLFKYATDLFSVIRTGVPTLSELTLDFNTFIRQYYLELKQKFIKDMVYIHAKNIIQFLQQLKQNEKNEEAVKKICQKSLIKDLHAKYKLSIQNFIKSANQILQIRQKQFAIFSDGEQILISLLKQVEENLLELMGNFYVEVSRYTNETEQFENIREIREKFQTSKLKDKQKEREIENRKSLLKEKSNSL